MKLLFAVEVYEYRLIVLRKIYSMWQNKIQNLEISKQCTQWILNTFNAVFLITKHGFRCVILYNEVEDTRSMKKIVDVHFPLKDTSCVK
jgi:hypothetical protein